MNRHLLCQSAVTKRSEFVNTRSSKPLKNNDEKHPSNSNSVLNEVKVELGKTKELLEIANEAINALKTDLQFTSKALDDFKLEHSKQLKALQSEILNMKQNFEPKKIENIDIQPNEPKIDEASENAALHKVYFKLPVNIISELKTFMKEVQDMKTYNYLKTRLSCIGGDGVTECVTYVLNAVLTVNLQKQISLTGKGTTKDSFLTDYKPIVSLIHDVVRSSNPDYKDKQGNKIIGTLLRSRK